MTTHTQQALLLIDLQSDFCAGGALAVTDGDSTVPVANHYAREFAARGQPVLITQDWHPADHGSFASQAGATPFTPGELDGLPQVWWPDHCIQNTAGAELHPLLDQSLISERFYKGQERLVDSYSGFFDNGHRRQTLLDAWLKQRGITALTVMGLATDYCVKFTVLDALALGYNVTVISEGCRGVNMQPEDSEQALAAMAAKGAIIL